MTGHNHQGVGIEFRHPRADEGAAVFDLIRNCPPLDQNSRYCNLLQCSHFAATCMAAFMGEDLVGFVSGYVIPEKPETLFVWQIAVSDKARGQGLALRLLKALLSAKSTSAVRRIETTITEDNDASWALFRKLSNVLEAPLSSEPFFTRETHFDGHHDTEVLVKIGPFETS